MRHNPEIRRRMITFEIAKYIIGILKNIGQFGYIFRHFQFLNGPKLIIFLKLHQHPKIDHHLIPYISQQIMCKLSQIQMVIQTC